MSLLVDVSPAPSIPPEAAPRPSAPPAPLRTAAWAQRLGPPGPEPRRSRHFAHVGALTAITALVAYLTWRGAVTLPSAGWGRTAAYALIAFEGLPLAGMVTKLFTLWNIDSFAAPPASDLPAGTRVVLLIPTYDEPVEVIAPTIAAGCSLEPAHETWVLDDGDRPWVAEMCEAYGARYVA